jgi:hypothetical protein
MSVDRIGWYLFLFLAALGLVFGLVGIAHGNPPTLRETIIREAPGLSSRSEPGVEPEALADAVLAATHSRQWAALLLTIAHHEAALSARIARGECRPLECDAGRAWGLGQVHRTQRNAAFWGSPDLAVQLKEMSHLARGAFDMCKSSGVPFPLSTLRGYAGRGCTGALKGEAQRVATYERLLRRL